jgi:hypothetical protein
MANRAESHPGSVGYLPLPRSLKVRGTPAESIQLVSLVVCEDKYAPLTTTRDFNNLSMKCTKIRISAYPSLSDEKSFHLGRTRLDFRYIAR